MEITKELKKQVYDNEKAIIMLRKDVDRIQDEDKDFDDKIKQVMEVVNKLVSTSLTLEVQLNTMKTIVYVLLTAIVIPVVILLINYVIGNYFGH